jgi:hypothetical protein
VTSPASRRPMPASRASRRTARSGIPSASRTPATSPGLRTNRRARTAGSRPCGSSPPPRTGSAASPGIRQLGRPRRRPPS